jgi:hypothetical protein
MLGDTPYEMFVQEYVAKNRPYNGVVFLETGGKKIMLKIKYAPCDNQTAVTDAYGYLKPEFDGTLFRLRNFDYSITHPAVSTRVHIPHFHSHQSERREEANPLNLGRALDLVSFFGNTAETYQRLGGGRNAEYFRDTNFGRSRTRLDQAISNSRTIPAVANYAGRFADAVKIYNLGVSFVNDGITLDNSVKLCFVALEKVLFKTLVAAGMKATGIWIIAGVYLITDMAVEAITGESIATHTATGIRRANERISEANERVHRRKVQFEREVINRIMGNFSPFRNFPF